jgi:hypothetical protein
VRDTGAMQARAIGLALAAIVLAVAPRSSRAEGGDFGLGLILGSPSGLCGKLYVADTHAVDFAVGEALIGNDGIHIHVDYLWHPWMLTNQRVFDLVLYVGIGGRFLDHDRGGNDDDDDFHLGPRVPFGVLFDFSPAGVAIDAFAEIGSHLDIIFDDEDDNGHDGLDFDLSAAIGGRYYF